MIGALIIIACLLGFIAMDLHTALKVLHNIDERIADVTTEDYRHLLRIRTTEDP